MSRTFSEEDKKRQAAALEAARQEKRELREARLKIGDYELFKYDIYNWCLVDKGGREGFFSSIESALQSIPKKLLNSGKYSSVPVLLDEIAKNNKIISDFIFLYSKELKEALNE